MSVTVKDDELIIQFPYHEIRVETSASVTDAITLINSACNVCPASADNTCSGANVNTCSALKVEAITEFNKVHVDKPEVKQEAIKEETKKEVTQAPSIGEVKGFKVYKKRYALVNSQQKEKFRDIVKNKVLNNSSDNSLIQDFTALLDASGIDYEKDFVVGNDKFSFKIGDDTLIEIAPYTTHNSVWTEACPEGLDSSASMHKSQRASKAGYHCIHVFDWDNKENIVKSLLTQRNKVFARQTEVCGVEKDEMKAFLIQNHLQGTCNGQSICVGLRDKYGELASIMTFGKPRYNKNYQYELIRYCSSKNVIGGSEKIFKHFIEQYNPESIISYCDMGKFSGDVYTKLGFTLKSSNSPSRHWYSKNEVRSHITDNFLRQRGYDQLFNESYGRGTSNEELMIARGYVPVMDCGQNTYEWHKVTEQ